VCEVCEGGRIPCNGAEKPLHALLFTSVHFARLFRAEDRSTPRNRPAGPRRASPPTPSARFFRTLFLDPEPEFSTLPYGSVPSYGAHVLLV